MVDWSTIPPDLWFEIAKRLSSYEDFAAVSGVCKSWRMASTKENLKSPPLVPWLMLADRKNSEGKILREFFSISRSQVHKIILPEAEGKWCLTSQGWLMILQRNPLDINLVHPLTCAHISLPSLVSKSYNCRFQIPFPFIQKVVLSANPSRTRDFIALVIPERGHYFAFCKLGDTVWTTINAQFGCDDAIFHKGQVYAVDFRGSILVCDIEGPNPIGTETLSMRQVILYQQRTRWQFYLVESAGHLLVVLQKREKLQDCNNYRTTKFQVFEVNLSNGEWEEVMSLGNRALFLGRNSSFSIEASEKSGCKANSIYFTYDCLECKLVTPDGKGKDMGVYNLEDGSLKEHYIVGGSHSNTISPMWVEPSFYSKFVE